MFNAHFCDLPQVIIHDSHPIRNPLLVYNSAALVMSFTQFADYTNQLVLYNLDMDGRFWSYKYTLSILVLFQLSIHSQPSLFLV